jgi:hypothetical protein
MHTITHSRLGQNSSLGNPKGISSYKPFGSHLTEMTFAEMNSSEKQGNGNHRTFRHRWLGFQETDWNDKRHYTSMLSARYSGSDWVPGLQRLFKPRLAPVLVEDMVRRKVSMRAR